MPIQFPAKQSGGGGGSPGLAFDSTVVNNSTESVLTLDKVQTKSAFFTYDIFRKSDTDPEAIRSGVLIATHKTDSDLWDISDLIEDFDAGNLTGTAFSINTATGEISYTSTNYDPTGYTSSIKLQQISELTQ